MTLDLALFVKPTLDDLNLTPACVYIRVSKVGGRTELVSPELQLTESLAHARRHGRRVVKIIEDIDESGRTFTKRRVDEVIADIKAGEYEIVILCYWSRWGRNTQESLLYIAKVQVAGGEIESAREHFDPSTSWGKYNRTQILAQAELQSDQIGDNWKSVQERRRTLGLPHTGSARFGYYLNPDGKSPVKYLVDETTRALVKDAYRRYALEGASIRGLALEWNDKGILTTTGNRWSSGSMRAMLDTGFAAGLIRSRSKQPKNGQPDSRTLAAFDKWLPGTHEAIIDEGLWKAYLGRRREQSARVPALRMARHGFSGLVFCVGCGGRFVAQYTGKLRHKQWRCVKGREQKLHPPAGLSDKRLTAALKDWFGDQAQGGDDVDDRVRRLAQQAQVKGEVAKLEKDLKALVVRRKRLVDLYTGGRMNDADYDEKYEEMEADVAKVDGRLAVARERERDSRAGGPPPERFRTLELEWDRWSPENQQAFLSTVCSGILIAPGGAVRFVPAWSAV